MKEQYVVLDEPVMEEQSIALQRAVERAKNAEAELERLKRGVEDLASPSPSMDAAASDHAGEESAEGHALHDPQMRGIEALRQDSMMNYLFESLRAGKDIGHYGRLVFAMIARHFLPDDEVVAALTGDRDFSVDQAVAMLRQVEEHDYSPPRRERIVEWQAEQDFQILPEPHDPDCGNVYRSLRFPGKTYKHISHYQEEKAVA